MTALAVASFDARTVRSGHCDRRELPHTPHTVAQALSTMPARHNEIIAAYASAADTALISAAAITLAVGALVVAELTWSARARAAG